MFNRFNRIKVVALGAMLVGLTVGTARAGVQNFEFVNLNKSASIVQAWLAPADTTEPWKAITIYTPVAPRSTSRININGYRTCMFNVKVRFDDGYEQSFSNIDLCTIEHLVAS
jgi:hypothetical protein